MLFTRSFFTITCIIISVVKAAPIIELDTITTTSTISDASFLLTESLAEYYENIVDQAMLDVSENVLTFIPDSISHGNVEGNYRYIIYIFIFKTNYLLQLVNWPKNLLTVTSTSCVLVY